MAAPGNRYSESHPWGFWLHPQSSYTFHIGPAQQEESRPQESGLRCSLNKPRSLPRPADEFVSAGNAVPPDFRGGLLGVWAPASRGTAHLLQPAHSTCHYRLPRPPRISIGALTYREPKCSCASAPRFLLFPLLEHKKRESQDWAAVFPSQCPEARQARRRCSNHAGSRAVQRTQIASNRCLRTLGHVGLHSARDHPENSSGSFPTPPHPVASPSARGGSGQGWLEEKKRILPHLLISFCPSLFIVERERRRERAGEGQHGARGRAGTHKP